MPAPADARERAMAFPRPRLPPVMRATRPVKIFGSMRLIVAGEPLKCGVGGLERAAGLQPACTRVATSLSRRDCPAQAQACPTFACHAILRSALADLDRA